MSDPVERPDPLAEDLRSRIRVLHLIKSLGRGGAEQLLLQVARHLEPSRFTSEVAFVLTEEDALAPALEAAGWRVRPLGGAGRAGWIPRLRALVRRGGFDVVHVHSPLLASIARIVLPRSLPIVYTEHNEWRSYRRPTYWANLLTYGRNTAVRTVSDQVRRGISYPRLLRWLPMPPVETLRHGVDVAAFQDALPRKPFPRASIGVGDGAPVVGVVANLRPQKGHAVLVEAVTELRRTVPDVRIVLVGGGAEEQAIRSRVAALRLERTVVLTGYRADAPYVMSCFDVFALPSLHEGLPIALIEALALGKPAVVTDAGGNAEVVRDGREGRVVRRGDPGALARALIEVLINEDLRRVMGERARRRAADFDIRTTVASLEVLYSQVGTARPCRAAV